MKNKQIMKEIQTINYNIKLFKYYCIINDLEVVKLLLEKGANIHADNDYPLRLSADFGHVKVVKLLLEKGKNY